MFTINGTDDRRSFHTGIRRLFLPWFFIGYWIKTGLDLYPAPLHVFSYTGF